MSLHRAIFRILIVVSGSIVLFLALLDAYWIGSYRETVRNEWKDTLNLYAESLDENLDEIRSDMYDIYYYDPNYQALTSIRDIEAFPYAYDLEDRLKTLTLLNKKALGYILLFNDLQNKRYYFSQGYFSNADVEAVKQVMAELSSMSPTIRSWFYPVINGRPYAISIYRNNDVALGEIYCLDTIETELEKELEKIHGEVFFESGGTVLGDEEAQLKYQAFLGHQEEIIRKNYVCRRSVTGTDLVLYLVVPMRFWTYLNAPEVVVLVITLFVVLFAIYSYFRVKKELFLPLDHLTSEMIRIGGGDWSSGIHTQSRFLEIQQVIGTTERMIEEIEAQKLLAYEKTIDEQKARLQYLSLQLNPHFYLNGLKTLNFLSMNGENERIQEIIIRLSEYLRYLLQLEKEMVTLESEIRFVIGYISLYREMTDRKISVEWRIARGVEDCLVPRLCIQTFVENSFKYARVGDAENPLEITITAGRFASETELFLEIIVQDNGAGYQEELLEVLNEAPSEQGASVGINNLKRRCEILYDTAAEYAFYNDGGAVSDVFYPWKEEDRK